MSKSEFVLPVALVGPADINRVLLELQMIDDAVRQATLHTSGPPKPAKNSRMTDSLAEANEVDISNNEDRERLVAFMESLQQHAPVLHISFASEPSAEFTAKIIVWLRQHISKYILVHIGLQPSIAAGCVIRSTNKVFDLSLRRHLQQKRGYLMDLMANTPESNANVAALAKPEVTA